MRVLVTGGAGYIGSVTTRWLAQTGHQPIVLDDLSTGHRAAVCDGAALVIGSIDDRALVRQLVERESIEAVIHLAARSLVQESLRDPLGYHETNVAGSISLLQACLAGGVERFVFSSSAAVYGVPTQVPINEQTPLNPISPYGQSKLLFEKILTDVSGAGQLAAVSLRYFNAAGAWPDGSLGEDHRPETHLIPLVLRSKEPFRIAGSDYPTEDGTCVRDFVHVCDLAEAHRLALESAQPGDHAIFNVGVGRGYSVRQVVETARQLTGLEIPSIEGPRRPSDPPSLVADTTRIQHALGFAPRHPGLETMIESAWAWHQAHPSGYATP